MSELFSLKGKAICVKLFIVGNSFITQGWFKVSFHRRLNSWWKWKCSSLSHVRLFSTLWTLACQAPLTMGFSQQEYWSGLPCPPPGAFLTQGSNRISSASAGGSLPLVPPEKPEKPQTSQWQTLSSFSALFLKIVFSPKKTIQ